jgi:hypothetical protein
MSTGDGDVLVLRVSSLLIMQKKFNLVVFLFFFFFSMYAECCRVSSRRASWAFLYEHVHLGKT